MNSLIVKECVSKSHVVIPLVNFRQNQPQWMNQQVTLSAFMRNRVFYGFEEDTLGPACCVVIFIFVNAANVTRKTETKAEGAPIRAVFNVCL